MQLFRCPTCLHWRCSVCDDRKRYQLRCCKCGELALAGQWYYGQSKGKPHDLEHSPRLFTGRPKDASKAVAVSLTQFLERNGIPLRAFTRHTEISGWAIRQAKAGVRHLSVMQETLIKATLERISAGKLWLRRVGRQRVELEWITPPYKQMCAMKLTHCKGGLLPGTCPRRWKECILSGNDWQAVEKIHVSQSGVGECK